MKPRWCFKDHLWIRILSAVGVDRRLKDDPDVSQVDLRLGMACVGIRLDTSFFPYFAETKFRYIWRKVLWCMASCMTMHKNKFFTDICVATFGGPGDSRHGR